MKTFLSTSVTVVILALSMSSIGFSNKVNANEGYLGKAKTVKQEQRQFRRMAKHLDLTDAQKQQFNTLKEQAKEKRTAMEEKMKSYKAQVNTLVSAAEFDEQAFLQLHSSYQNFFSEKAMLRAKHKHQMMQILTPEQQEKAKQMKDKKRGKRH